MIALERLEVSHFKALRSVSVAFPARGAILVEGPNESGKSTLFESIFYGLYGAPIATEENRGSLEDLVSYGEEAASVKLWLRAGERGLAVERSIRRGKPTRAKLTLSGGDADEVLTGVRAVNARIVEELGGLDGSALLNSCFVEQKKLSKLEELDARERRDSLLRILNLEQLSRLEEQYRVRQADERRVRELGDRSRLAGLAGEAKALRAEVEEGRAAYLREEVARGRQALRRAQSRHAAAEEYVGKLRTLEAMERELERDAAIPAAPSPGPGPRASNAAMRDLLIGLTISSGLLVAGLILLAAGSTLPGAAALLLAVVVGAAAGYRVVQASGADARPGAVVSAPRRGTDAARAAAVAELRAELELEPDGDTLAELGNAERAVGSAEAAVRQARELLDTLGEGVDDRPDARDGAPLDILDIDVGATRWVAPAAPGTTLPPHLARDQTELQTLEAEVRHLSTVLGVEGDGLDAAACDAAYSAARREQEIARRAGVIVGEARKRLVERVLPETERNMKLILPLLTAGRYHDARIMPDYKLAVWDPAAGRYVAKGVFSGGTKDQLSLALRLAFAIASLPRELGSSPGFLFMDEPLSSFDEERTQALIELITRGRLAEIFPQICIISHSRSFDRSLFPHVIELAGGAIEGPTAAGGSAGAPRRGAQIGAAS